MEQEELYQTLKKICTSSVFEKSHQNVKILEYLVKQALNNEHVKEYSLGIEIFGQNFNPDESTSKVRVAMFKFRKKLEQYYNNEGKEDEIIFEVKKGQYNLTFTNKSNTIEKPKTHKKTIAIAGLILLLLIATIAILKKTQNKTFWDFYFNSKSNNICFVADQFVVTLPQINNASQFLVRTDITNKNDFQEFQQKNEDTTIRAANFTFLSKMAPIAINDMAWLFANNNSNMTVRLESEFQYNDMSDHNMIFIGHNRNFQNAKSLFLSNSKVFQYENNGFIYKQSNNTTHYKNSFNKASRVDYSMLSFMKLDNNQKALFITSNHDIGVIALCKKLTNKKQLQEFYTHIPDTITYFNALFKVSGMGRTDIGCELIHIEFIPE
jgi:hypothetical protein